ncbi:S1 family peptidase [Bradyrhizobium elkanii]|uniref:S1 family peptidase n=1 Tax=Bradyrhizobium elkanii TaxID=29448 RepID=UPI001BADB495|nr:trypsin-like serine protease [Bradyrhizobium elkanii]MBR1164606.1 trypsin-like serine protease [Bradyrhizobium elkanii]
MSRLIRMTNKMGVLSTFALIALSSEALCQDKGQEIKALDFAKQLHQSSPGAVLPTYRNMLEVLGAAKTLDKVDATSLPGRNSTLILHGTPTVIEQDARTQSNFLAVGEDQDRIWKGVKTSDANNKDLFPDAVAIRTDHGALCSGALINQDTVVTAAHCFCSQNIPELVIFGTSIDIGAQATKVVPVDKTKSMPKMQCGAYKDGDVGLVRLSQPVDIAARRIASQQAVDSAKAVRIVGFGKTEQGTSGTKLMVDVPITSHTCQGSNASGADEALFGCNPDFELVASAPLTDQDSCNGDSGGGVYVEEPKGVFSLAAVVSRGIKTPSVRPCGDGGIYPRLDKGAVNQWIKENAGSALP